MIKVFTEEDRPEGYSESYVVLFKDKLEKRMITIRYYTYSKNRHKQVKKYWENKHQPRSRYEFLGIVYE